MKKTSRPHNKKRLILLIVLILIAAALAAGVIYLRDRNNKAFVQPVSDMNCSWIMYNSSSTGIITDAAEQTIRLPERETVAEVYVAVGDRVTEGQALFRYDTSSQELTVRQQELEVESCAASLATARQKLTAYENIVPSAPAPAPSEPEPYRLTPEQQLPAACGGSGSAEDPFVYLCTAETLLTGEQIDQWIEQGQVARLELREGNDPAGELRQVWTVDGRNFLTVAADSLWRVSDRSRFIPPEPEPEPEPAEPTYTQAEKDKLISDQKLTIRRMENSLSLAENALDQAKGKLADATVRANLAGTVKTIGDPAAPPQDGSPFCTIAAASGVTLTGYISELDLGRTRVGERLNVLNWMTGESTEATIIELSDYPADSQAYQGSGNPNVSYYEFTAYMENSSGFEAGQGVDIQPWQDDADDCIVLESIYVLTDGQGAYMLVDDGSGRLARRDVTVTPTPESGYLQITTGLTLDDYVAFPHGKTAHVGCLTTTDRPLSLF